MTESTKELLLKAALACGYMVQWQEQENQYAKESHWVLLDSSGYPSVTWNPLKYASQCMNIENTLKTNISWVDNEVTAAVAGSHIRMAEVCNDHQSHEEARYMASVRCAAAYWDEIDEQRLAVQKRR